MKQIVLCELVSRYYLRLVKFTPWGSTFKCVSIQETPLGFVCSVKESDSTGDWEQVTFSFNGYTVHWTMAD